jgi:hypothetical protein
VGRQASQSGDSRAAERAAVELEDLLDEWQCKYPDVNARRDVVNGHPGRVLADLSARADLVVLGRHNANDRSDRARRDLRTIAAGLKALPRRLTDAED